MRAMSLLRRESALISEQAAERGVDTDVGNEQEYLEVETEEGGKMVEILVMLGCLSSVRKDFLRTALEGYVSHG